MALQELAGQVREEFHVKTRDSGDQFWTREHTGDRDWIQEMCYEAHGNMLPDDYRYSMIVDALDAISESDTGADPDDWGDLVEYLSEPPHTYYELAKYLGSHGERFGIADEAVEEFGGNSASISDIITLAYRREQEEVLKSVLGSLTDRLKELEEGVA